MSEGYNYQLLTGIVKVIRPNSKPVLGISDGKGLFMWLPTDKIIMSHPMQFENWQTTIFAIAADWKITWKAEQKWEDFKSSYPTNTKPILQPIPDIFRAAVAPAQQPSVPTTTTQPINYPPPTITTPPINYPQQSTTPIPQQSGTLTDKVRRGTLLGFRGETPLGLQAEDPVVQVLKHIATELTNIRNLLRIYINPPKLTTADALLTDEEVTNQYGSPPEEVPIETKINKDDLPSIF